MDITDDRDEILRKADFMADLIRAELALPEPQRILSDDGIRKLRIFAQHAYEMAGWSEPVSWKEYIEASNRICDG